MKIQRIIVVVEEEDELLRVVVDRKAMITRVMGEALFKLVEEAVAKGLGEKVTV